MRMKKLMLAAAALFALAVADVRPVCTVTLAGRELPGVLAVGDQARYLAEGAQSAGMTAVYPCADKKAARELLPGLIRPDSTILVKASRGMRMEELVDQLLELTPEQ